MIDIKDLQIGNWVMTPYGLHKIDTIYDGAGRVSADLIKLDISELEAIPITPEILEKSGFEHNHGEMFYDGKSMFHHKEKYLSIEYGVNGFWHLHITKGCELLKAIKYIHELQHALRLCGIEKEIKL